MAREEIERDRVVDVVRTLPLHSKLVLASILMVTGGGSGYATTGEVYERYRYLTLKLGIETVTLRRVSGILAELDMLGVITGRVVSRGRYGKTRVLELALDPQVLYKTLSEDIALGDIIDEVGREFGKRSSMR
jgi:cell division control protein 6